MSWMCPSRPAFGYATDLRLGGSCVVIIQGACCQPFGQQFGHFNKSPFSILFTNLLGRGGRPALNSEFDVSTCDGSG